MPEPDNLVEIPQGWMCEDCAEVVETTQEAFKHQDRHGHNMFLAPLASVWPRDDVQMATRFGWAWERPAA